jgi:hypothetical protein
MTTTLTKEQLSLIRRLAGGAIKAPPAIRIAAHNIVIGAADDTNYETILQYAKTNKILA